MVLRIKCSLLVIRISGIICHMILLKELLLLVVNHMSRDSIIKGFAIIGGK